MKPSGDTFPRASRRNCSSPPRGWAMCGRRGSSAVTGPVWGGFGGLENRPGLGDRKSTRLNSSHSPISYAVFCFKKKKQILYIHASFILQSQVTQLRDV